MLALLTFSGTLWVVSTDLHHSRLEFDTTSQSAEGKVRQVEWCGNDAILVSWDGLAVMVGPLGDTLKYALSPPFRCFTLFFKIHKNRYYYPGPIHTVSEIDGVRIIGPGTCDFLEKVPGRYPNLITVAMVNFMLASTFSIFRPGSTSPAAILYDAWEHFTRRSPKADEHIRSIRPELASAVDDCIDAAGREWEPYWQRRLLNVHQYPRSIRYDY